MHDVLDPLKMALQHSRESGELHIGRSCWTEGEGGLLRLKEGRNEDLEQLKVAMGRDRKYIR